MRPFDLGNERMNGTWYERLNRWICQNFGHRGHIDYTSAGGGDPEICRRCNALLSTAYSRDKEANAQAKPRRETASA